MFENSKNLLRGWFGDSGTPPVYLGTQSAYLDQIALPLSIGTKNDFNPTSDAEKISVVITCIKILSDTISRLPLHIYTDSEMGHLPDKTDYRYPFLHYSPDDIITAQSFFSALEYNRNLKGNAFALISRNRNTGRVTGLHFIPSNFIGGYKQKGSQLYYIYYEPQENGKTKEKLVNSSDVLHFKMTTKNSFWGINPLEAQRQNMSTIYKSKATIDNFYENNAFTPKVLKSNIPDAAFQKTVIEAIQKFREVNVGVGNSGKILTLPPFTEIQELNLNVVDQQFVSGQKFDSTQIASFFGIPPHMVGIMESSRFSNVEQMSLDFRASTVSAIARMYRQELEFKLLTQEERIEGKSIEFALNSLIELDITAKTTYYRAMRNELGCLTSNQINLFEGLPTFPGGDVHIMPLNYGVIGDDGTVLPTTPPDNTPAPKGVPEDGRSLRGAPDGNTNACKKGKYSTGDSNYCEGELTEFDEDELYKLKKDGSRLESASKYVVKDINPDKISNKEIYDLLTSPEPGREGQKKYTKILEAMAPGYAEKTYGWSDISGIYFYKIEKSSGTLSSLLDSYHADRGMGSKRGAQRWLPKEDILKLLNINETASNIGIGLGKGLNKPPEQGGSFKRPGRSEEIDSEQRGAPKGNANACKKGKYATADSDYCEGEADMEEDLPDKYDDPEGYMNKKYIEPTAEMVSPIRNKYEEELKKYSEFFVEDYDKRDRLNGDMDWNDWIKLEYPKKGAPSEEIKGFFNLMRYRYSEAVANMRIYLGDPNSKARFSSLDSEKYKYLPDIRKAKQSKAEALKHGLILVEMSNIIKPNKIVKDLGLGAFKGEQSGGFKRPGRSKKTKSEKR